MSGLKKTKKRVRNQVNNRKHQKTWMNKSGNKEIRAGQLSEYYKKNKEIYAERGRIRYQKNKKKLAFRYKQKKIEKKLTAVWKDKGIVE